MQSIDLPMKNLVILTIVNDSSPWLMVNILLMLVNDDGYYIWLMMIDNNTGWWLTYKPL